ITESRTATVESAVLSAATGFLSEREGEQAASAESSAIVTLPRAGWNRLARFIGERPLRLGGWKRDSPGERRHRGRDRGRVASKRARRPRHNAPWRAPWRCGLRRLRRPAN